MVRAVGRVNTRPSAFRVAANVGRHVGAYAAGVATRELVRRGARGAAQSVASNVSQAFKKRKRTKSKGRSKYPSGIYATTGHPGKKFKKGKKPTYSKVRRRGTQSLIESGGVVASDDAIYIGHSLPGASVFIEVCRAVTKRLFQKAGYRILAMQDKIQSDTVTHIVRPGDITIHYRRSSGDTVQTLTVQIAADSTFAECALLIRDSLLGLCNTPSTRPEILLDEVMFFQFDGAGNLLRSPSAKLWFNSVMIHLACSSKLHLQNRTIAGIAGTTDQTNVLDVANNPLDGRLYSGKGSNLQLKFAENVAGALTDVFISDPTSGITTVTPSTAGNYTPEMMSIYKRPPSAYAFKHVTSGSVARLNPGEIKISKFFFERTMSFQSYFAQNYMYFYQLGLSKYPRHSIGLFRTFGFEKRCNTTVDEPQISIGYEVNTVLTCSISEKPTVTLRDVLTV